MSTDQFRSADALDDWWDAYQRGEITDGIPLDDMNLIQELSTMHAHAISSADEQRVWRRTSEQIKRREDGGFIQRLIRFDLGQVFGGQPSWRLPRAASVISMITVVAMAVLIAAQFTPENGQRVILAPENPASGSTPLTGVPMYRGDSARTGVMPGPGPESTPVVIWQTQLQGSILHQPLLVDGTIFVDDGSGWVYAIDAMSGVIKWQISTGVGGETALAIGSEMVFATAYDGTLLALDMETGKERWRDDRARPRFPVLVIDDRVILDTVIEPENGNEDGAIYTLDAATGEEIDAFTFTGAFRNLASVSNGVIYGIDLQSNASAYDLTTHQRLWRVLTGSRSIEPISVSGGIAFIPLETSNPDGQVLALDATTGEELWRRGTIGNSPLGAAVVTDGTYYAVARDGTLYANIATDGVGQFYESYFGGAWEVVAPPAYANETVYMADQGGTVVGTRGLMQDRWEMSIPGYVYGGPIVAGDFLWVGNSNGTLFALGPVESSVATPAATNHTPAASDNTGAAQVEWTSQSGLSYPLDVAIDDSGNAYLVDPGNEQVAVIGPDGELIQRIGTFGDGPGEFHFRDYDAGEHGGIDIAPDGLIYVADPFNNRIQVFDAGFKYLREWGSAGTGDGQFNRPTDILVNGDRVYVSDYGNNRVQIFTLDGQYVSQFGQFGSDDGEFNGPADLAADGNGNIYVGEWVGARIQLFRADGTYVGVFADRSHFVEVWGLAVDPQGNVIAVDAAAGAEKMLVFNPLGILIAEYDTYDNGVSMYPVSVAVHTDGSIQIADWEGETNLVKIRVPEVSGAG